MQYEQITLELSREPVEVSILVDDQIHSGPFIANRQRRGIIIAASNNQICLTADESLALLDWLQKQEDQLREMLDEETSTLGAVEQRLVLSSRSA